MNGVLLREKKQAKHVWKSKVTLLILHVGFRALNLAWHIKRFFFVFEQKEPNSGPKIFYLTSSIAKGVRPRHFGHTFAAIITNKNTSNAQSKQAVNAFTASPTPFP